MLTLESKPGVEWVDMAPALEQVQDVIGEHYAKVGDKAIVTSARDSKHSKHTAHADGRAMDLRITKLFAKIPHPSAAVWWRMVFEFGGELADRLERATMLRGIPGRFDVVLEATPPHLHLEWTESGKIPNIIGWKAAQKVYATAEARSYMVTA